MSNPAPRNDASQGILRRGAVAVIVRQERLLIIRRSQHVIAPGLLCFPGGGIEGEESETEALVREIREELGAAVMPVRRLWESVTHWRVHLAFWLGALDPAEQLVPNPLEVESVHWLTPQELDASPDMLDSNRDFLAALQAGRVALH